MDRSYLFAPGHNAKLLGRVFEAGADAVMLDLEDAVPPDAKDTARAMVAEALVDHRLGPGQRRPHRVVRGRPGRRRRAGVRDQDPQDRVSRRRPLGGRAAPGKPIICAIESARGVLAAAEIASVPGVRHLAMGGVDLQNDLNAGNGNLQTLYVRSHLVVVSRAAGLEAPIDSVYPRLDDEAGLREQAEFARSLGFFGKSAIHPRQLPVLHQCSPPPSGSSAGPARSWLPSRPPEAPRSSCPAGSSSTCRWRNAPAVCWSWRSHALDRRGGMSERPYEFVSTPEGPVLRVRARGFSVLGTPMLNRDRVHARGAAGPRAGRAAAPRRTTCCRSSTRRRSARQSSATATSTAAPGACSCRWTIRTWSRSRSQLRARRRRRRPDRGHRCRGSSASVTGAG